MNSTARLLLTAAILVSIPIGCAQTGPLKVHLDRQVVIPERSVIVFFVDGMRVDLARHMAAEGQLPNISRYIIDAGTEVQYAVTSVPSITYANTASMTTGLFPGHHHIMGNCWFDPNIVRFQDYRLIRTYQQVDNDLYRPTIYQLLADKFTVTIQTANRSGATRPIDNWATSGINWFFGQAMAVDQLGAVRLELISRLANRVGRWPELIFAYFPALDEIGHRHGADSKQYRRALINVDCQIGRICQALVQQGLLDRCYRILISDHGHVPAAKDRYWRPDRFLTEQLGIATTSKIAVETSTYERRAAHFNKYRAVVVNGGPRRAHIHLRAGDQWFQTADYQAVQQFVDKFGHVNDRQLQSKSLPMLLGSIPAVRLVAVKVQNDIIELIWRNSVARVIRQDNGRKKLYAYKVLQGPDPLGYSSQPTCKELTGGRFANADQWLKATAASQFPDLVVQIVEMFDSPRAGQIVVFADRGWDFHENDLGGHGSVLAEDMLIPLAFAGPGIVAGGTLDTARLVDLMPTVLEMLGCQDRLAICGRLDGKSLLGQLMRVSNN